MFGLWNAIANKSLMNIIIFPRTYNWPTSFPPQKIKTCYQLKHFRQHSLLGRKISLFIYQLIILLFPYLSGQMCEFLKIISLLCTKFFFHIFVPQSFSSFSINESLLCIFPVFLKIGFHHFSLWQKNHRSVWPFDTFR